SAQLAAAEAGAAQLVRLDDRPDGAVKDRDAVPENVLERHRAPVFTCPCARETQQSSGWRCRRQTILDGRYRRNLRLDNSPGGSVRCGFQRSFAMSVIILIVAFLAGFIAPSPVRAEALLGTGYVRLTQSALRAKLRPTHKP